VKGKTKIDGEDNFLEAPRRTEGIDCHDFGDIELAQSPFEFTCEHPEPNSENDVPCVDLAEGL
jgi:hypothetical protein